MKKVIFLLLVLPNLAFAANNEKALEKDENRSDAIVDLRKTPDPWTIYCRPRLKGAEPSEFVMLRKQALANMMANAFTAAFDNPKLVSNDRCFATMSTFGHFMYGKRTEQNPGRIRGFLGEALVGRTGPRIPIINKDGAKEWVFIDCAEVMKDHYPEFFDDSEKATNALVKSMLKNRNEMKRLLNESLQGHLKTLNYPKAIVQDVIQDSEDPACVKVKAFSPKENGGYGYERIFRFCEDSEKSTCGEYYGEGVAAQIKKMRLAITR